MKAMILAAGKGTRLKPYTDQLPKALIAVNHLTMLEHQINYLTSFDVNEIIINVHHFPEQIRDFIRKKKYKFRIEFSDEKDELLDTGGGLKKASWFFDDGNPFFLIGIDIFTDLNLNELMSFHKLNNSLATLAVKKRKSTRDFLINRNNQLCGWKNNLTGEEIIIRNANQRLMRVGFSVIHVISPEIFTLMTGKNIFPMTGFYLELARQHPVMVYIHNTTEWYEAGRIENLLNQTFLNKVKRIQDLFLNPGLP